MDTKRITFEEKWILIGALSGVLLLIGIMAAYFIMPGVSRVQVGEGEVILSLEDNGKLTLSWPAPQGNALSRVSIRPEGEKRYTVLNEYTGNMANLDSSFLERPFELRIQTSVHGKNLLGIQREALSVGSIEISVDPPGTLQTELQAEAAGPGKLHLSWTGDGDYELRTADRDHRLLQTVSGGDITLNFDEENGLELPSYDGPLQLTMRAVRHGEGYVLYGPYIQPVSITRESLLGSALSLELQELNSRSYILRWNETKGDSYEVQEWSEAVKAWVTLTKVYPEAPLQYETGLLRPGSNHSYRVVVIGGAQADSVEPAQVSVRAGVSALYAAVWPVVDLTLYDDAAMTKYLDTIPAGASMCVVEENADSFKVRYRNQYGYVDNRYCMINLPEYVGDYCIYDITNSYSSIFKVHDNPIQYITGEVLPGFERVNTPEDGYLVPYLYPSAKKLLTAAQAAEEDGYRLRIYEAFRPNESTRYLYETTAAQLDYPIPEQDAAGNYVFHDPSAEDPDTEPGTSSNETPSSGGQQQTGSDTTPSTTSPSTTSPSTTTPSTTPSTQRPSTPTTPPPVEVIPTPEPEPEPEPDPDEPPAPTLPDNEQTLSLSSRRPDTAQQAASPEEAEVGLQEETQPEAPKVYKRPTYRQIMTDGRYGVSSFLTSGVSSHNRGIALDLAIEKLDGTPLPAQSAMHDLSWHSATHLNNDNAKLLESYMTMSGVGMKGLSSKWWHFQDDATRSVINLDAYLDKGVTAEGWKNDGFGWRYRFADGRYAQSVTIRIDGRSYTVDANGYVTE